MKLAQLKKQINEGTRLIPLLNSVFSSSFLVKEITIEETTQRGYTYSRKGDSAISFATWPSEEEILCISEEFITLRQNSAITVFEFAQPTKRLTYLEK